MSPVSTPSYLNLFAIAQIIQILLIFYLFYVTMLHAPFFDGLTSRDLEIAFGFTQLQIYRLQLSCIVQEFLFVFGLKFTVTYSLLVEFK